MFPTMPRVILGVTPRPGFGQSEEGGPAASGPPAGEVVAPQQVKRRPVRPGGAFLFKLLLGSSVAARPKIKLKEKNQ